MTIEFDELENLLLNLSAGLDINNLTEDEIELLKNEYGENWKQELGYEENETENELLTVEINI